MSVTDQGQTIQKSHAMTAPGINALAEALVERGNDISGLGGGSQCFRRASPAWVHPRPVALRPGVSGAGGVCGGRVCSSDGPHSPRRALAGDVRGLLLMARAVGGVGGSHLFGGWASPQAWFCDGSTGGPLRVGSGSLWRGVGAWGWDISPATPGVGVRSPSPMAGRLRR